MKATAPPFRTLVITGGSSGIGRAILDAFARRHPTADIVNLSRTAPAPPAPPFEHMPVDLADPEAADDAIRRLHTRLDADDPTGPVLLVNNSGLGRHGPFHQTGRDENLRTIDLNLAAPVRLTLGLLPALRARGGHIVTVASTSAFQPTPMMAVYGATKTALLHWTLALGEELRGTGLRTLALCPGPTRTPFLPKAGFDRPVRSPWGLRTPDEVAAALFKGLERGRSLVVPGCPDRWIARVAAAAPRTLSAKVAGRLMRHAKRQ